MKPHTSFELQEMLKRRIFLCFTMIDFIFLFGLILCTSSLADDRRCNYVSGISTSILGVNYFLTDKNEITINNETVLANGYTDLSNNIWIYLRNDYSNTPERTEWVCNHEWCHNHFKTLNETFCDEFASNVYTQTVDCNHLVYYLTRNKVCD